MMMMIPEAYAGRDDLPPELRGVLRLPRVPDGAVGRPRGDRVHRRPRDRRDARPQRPAARPLARDRRTAGSCSRPRPACSTSPPANILRKGRLQPGKLFLVDLEQGRIVPDDELKREIATQQPYGEWFEREVVRLADLPRPPMPARAADRVAAAAPARVRLHAART